MREIKFRVWFPHEKKLRGGNFVIFNGRLNEIFQGHEIFMQYVGAKDVNDKEIYEGDIVKMHYFAEGYDPQTLVAFETDIAVVGVVKMGVFGTVTRTTDGKEYIWACLLEDVGKEIEVLGNIYENPDLIEQEGERGEDGREIN